MVRHDMDFAQIHLCDNVGPHEEDLSEIMEHVRWAEGDALPVLFTVV